MHLGACRSVFLRRHHPCLSRIAVPLCAFPHDGIPARLRFFFYSHTAFAMARRGDLRRLGRNLRRDWLSSLHAAANRTAVWSARFHRDFIIFVHGGTPFEIVGVPWDDADCVWCGFTSGPTGLVLGVPHSGNDRTRSDGRWAVRLLVDRHRRYIYRATDRRVGRGRTFHRCLRRIDGSAFDRPSCNIKAPPKNKIQYGGSVEAGASAVLRICYALAAVASFPSASFVSFAETVMPCLAASKRCLRSIFFMISRTPRPIPAAKLPAVTTDLPADVPGPDVRSVKVISTSTVFAIIASS